MASASLAMKEDFSNNTMGVLVAAVGMTMGTIKEGLQNDDVA